MNLPINPRCGLPDLKLSTFGVGQFLRPLNFGFCDFYFSDVDIHYFDIRSDFAKLIGDLFLWHLTYFHDLKISNLIWWKVAISSFLTSWILGTSTFSTLASFLSTLGSLISIISTFAISGPHF